ncbi:MAG: hypothetical protein CMI12_12455 [Oceanospirillum sp.]|nr:hypothetical protein [Oceanospirillum sp.]
MKGLYADLTKLTNRHGTKGLVLLILLHFGCYTLLTDLVSLFIDAPPFVNTWAVLIFSCAMVAAEVRIGNQSNFEKQ